MCAARSPKDYLDEANSRDTTPDRLAALADAEWPFVRSAVARNPNTGAEVLAKLVPERLEAGDEDLAAAIAGRDNAPPEALRTLARGVLRLLSAGRPARMIAPALALCSNPSVPVDVIQDLVVSPQATKWFRGKVAAHTGRHDVLAILAADRSGTVSDRARRRQRELTAVGTLEGGGRGGHCLPDGV